jgi:hypothetical protein
VSADGNGFPRILICKPRPKKKHAQSTKRGWSLVIELVLAGVDVTERSLAERANWHLDFARSVLNNLEIAGLVESWGGEPTLYYPAYFFTLEGGGL